MSLVVANTLVLLEQASVILCCVFAIILHKKLKLVWSLVLTIGIMVIIGQKAVDFFYSTFFAAGQPINIEISQLPTYYYVMEATHVLGLLAIATGFAGIALRTK